MLTDRGRTKGENHGSVDGAPPDQPQRPGQSRGASRQVRDGRGLQPEKPGRGQQRGPGPGIRGLPWGGPTHPPALPSRGAGLPDPRSLPLRPSFLCSPTQGHTPTDSSQGHRQPAEPCAPGVSLGNPEGPAGVAAGPTHGQSTPAEPPLGGGGAERTACPVTKRRGGPGRGIGRQG